MNGQAPPGWDALFRGHRQPGEVSGLDTLRVWWLLQELEVAGVTLHRGDGDQIIADKRPGARGLDDRLRDAIRKTRPALLAWIDAQTKQATGSESNP